MGHPGTKHFFRKLLDDQLGPFKFEGGFYHLDVYRLTRQGVIRTYDTASEIKMTFGQWQAKYDLVERKFTPLRRIEDVLEGTSIDDTFTVTIGGTASHPYSQNAVNTELKVDLAEAVRIFEWIFRRRRQ